MKRFEITENDANQRLDKFLKKLLPNAALSLIYRMNRKNQVKVNRKREDNEYKLCTGDTIEVFLKDEDYEALSTMQKKPALEMKGQGLDKKDVVYEDGEILVVNKNPGINVHPGDHKTNEVSLIEQVHDYLGDKLSSLTFRPSLIHRIDRDTSGIIMIAKTKPALDHMLRELQNDKMEKSYLAICVGKPPETRGTIRKRLLRREDAQNENKVVVDEKNGQNAVTHYQVLAIGIHEKYSLVECTLETGRMHQIRVHMTALGCPILGDATYGDRGENSFARREYGVTRQMLHASHIRFIHPKKKTEMILNARLKGDMEGLLEGVDFMSSRA